MNSERFDDAYLFIYIDKYISIDKYVKKYFNVKDALII